MLVTNRGGTALSLGTVTGSCRPGRAGRWSAGCALASLVALSVFMRGCEGVHSLVSRCLHAPALAFSSFLLLCVR